MNVRHLSLAGILLFLTSYVCSQSPANPSQTDELVLANHILANENVVDAYGHVSVRDERNANHFLLARAIASGSVTAADIITYDLDSNAIGDTRASFTERFIHGQIYRARPDVMAIVHFHAAEVIPFSVSSVPLKPIIHMAAFLPQVIPIFEIRTAGGMTDMLIRDNKLGKALADQLADKSVVLLRGHGATVVGPNLHITTGRAYYTVAKARVQAQAMQLAGGADNLVFVDPEETKKFGDGDGYERFWNYGKFKDAK